ncbi:TetR/AcrR family transcriptional regulator [Nocardia sp. NPDC056100]|uniref:TetR/AcrR family transcriptional regulator n=1 Tax=Nocardia sp. NPDC056100 TaxID=3345712 RepID=UPI0035D688B9
MPRQTREEMLAELRAVALRTFVVKGYEGASLAEIAQVVGYSKGALLYHFGSKERLLAEILAPASANVEALVRELSALPRKQRRERAVPALTELAMRDRMEVACYSRLAEELPDDPAVRRMTASAVAIRALIIDDDAPLSEVVRVQFALVGLFQTPVRLMDVSADDLRGPLQESFRAALADVAPL